MDTIADYNAWKDKQQQNGVGAAQVVLGSVNEKPDEIAGDLNLANEFGKATGNPVPPLPMVREYRNVFQQKIEEQKNKTILSSKPRLTEWLRSPDNAALARDDLQNLSWFEGFGRGVTNTLSRSGDRLSQMGNQFMFEQTAGRDRDRSKLFGQILQEEKTSSGLKDMQGNPLETWTGAEYLGAFGRWVDARYADMIGADDNAAAVQFAEGVKASQDRLAATPKSATAQSFEKAAIVKDATAGQAIANFGTAFLQNPIGGLSWAMETAGESAPQLAAALVASRFNPALGVGVLGGGSYATERYTAPADFLAEKGIDLGKPEDVQRVLSDPKLLEEAAKRGVIRGAIVGAFDLLSGGLAGKAASHNPIVEAIAQSAQQAILGSAGEYSARVASGQPIDWNDIVAEGVAEIATAPVDMGVAGREFAANRRKAKTAEGTVAQLGEISANAQASAVRARTPDKFRQFVEAATANGPVENVYVPAEQFSTYFQSLGVDPYALVDELDGVSRDDLDIALAGGGDLQIPTATYAAKIAGTEHDAFLMENMRFDPNEFTALEAKEFNERAQDAMDEAFQAAETARLEDEGSRSFEQQIYDTMVSRLREAGRSTDVATTEATLYPAFYRTMAERSGQTVEDFMAAYPLPQVSGSIPEGMQFRDVDALNRTLAEARARRSAGFDKRQSLLEFISDYGGINDVGGNLKARDAAVIKRKGKKSLKLARGGIVDGVRDMFGQTSGKKHGIDDVAQAAIEAGYLVNDPVATDYRNAVKEGREVPNIGNALLDAIDRELRGEADYAVPADAAAADHSAQLDQIEAYLSSLGVGLDDDDAAIRAAVQADQADEGKKYGQSGDVRGPRGSIQFPGGGVGNGDTVVRLFEGADLSTFLHESGHYFLTVLRDLAAKGEASSSGDMESVKAWWGENADAVAKDGMRVMPDVTLTADDVNAALANGTTGDLMKDAAVDVGMQEQWARGFEAYLMEGKAPSIELRGAFEKFRSWLISVYRRLAGLNVTVSDGIREVFDRMVASDDEIAKAKEQAGDRGPIFATADEMGLTPGEFASFLKLRDQAEDDAKARLLREAMAPVKRAQEKWFKEERAKVREEVERQVNTYRYYRAWEWMGNRRWWDAETEPEGMPDIRLSKEILVQRYGEGVLKTLPRGMQTIYAVEGGVDPDDAAGWFGFDSGDELVQALEKAPPRKEAIEAETDKLMRERHGDVLTDGSVEAAALDALHSDKRGQWIAAELKAVVEVAGAGLGMTAKEARASARASIARMRVRDAVNSSRFLAAERKAADDAAKLGAMLSREKVWLDASRRRIETKARSASKGSTSPDTVATAIDAYNAKFETTQSTFTVPDREAVSKSGNAFTIKGGERTATSLGYNDLVAKLVETKRRQLVNHALYMEARNVAGEVEKAENFVAKLGKKSTRERIAGAGRRENAQVDYLGAIDEILERYDFRKLSGAAEGRRGALNAFVAAMTAAGRENELAIPEAVLSDAARRPYKTLPVEEMRGVVDSLKNLEHMATRWNKLIDAQKQRELEAVVTDVVAAFDANMPKRPPGRVGTKGEALRHSVRQFFDLVLNAGTILREIDGFKDLGAAYRNIKTPIDEAMDRLTVRKLKAAGDLESLYAVYDKADRRRMAVRDHIPELGYALSKWERIAVALNLGNAGNRARLTDPKVRGSLTEAQIAAVIATLDAKDAAFVQSVWDYVGSFRDDIAARERRATGVEPEWVEATPVEIAGKTLKGGYYPLKYDPRLSSLARDDEANNIAQALQAGRFGKAQTRQGHLKERVRSSGRDVELDMSVLHRHVNQVIYDLELSEPVANSWRILQNGEIRSAFMEAGKQADFDALEIWLKDVAEGELKSADLVGRAARTLKSNFTAAKLAFNISTVAMQVTGLSQSMVVVGKKDMAVGIMQAAKNPVSMARDIAAKSPFMASRQTTFNKDIFDFYSDPKTGPVASRWGEIKAEIVGPMSFWLMTKVQWYLADVPTWLAGYRQGLRQYGNDEAKAVAHADAVVKRAQASGLFADRSAVERGSVSRTARQNDVVRLFTALGSYMFAKFNVAYERTAKAKRLIGQDGFSARSAQEALSWTLDMAFLFTLEAVVGAAIRGRLPDDEDDKDDEWAAFLAKQTAFSVMGTLPFIRDSVSAMQGFEAGGAYGSFVKDVVRGGKGVADILTAPFLEDGKVNASDLKAVINATCLATGLPAVQINRFVDAAWRQAEGKDVSPLEYLLGRIGG
ncbi:hypothetical protein X759_21720 [Mesorhizobium sp. LSHC420B00]|uniref:hypothetical protein n=1 Tax=unclassified Mesorhizobium TaxID=325217 RepID=UPI0003CF8B65|nr:hypothetical protein [Mesorhizobium sp. LSHC420B00]ESX70658.1 hypothetical protein X759_21720 [Mesorhizobium sp. LSHC420B00]